VHYTFPLPRFTIVKIFYTGAENQLFNSVNIAQIILNIVLSALVKSSKKYASFSNALIFLQLILVT
jgi:hypothetical protein